MVDVLIIAAVIVLALRVRRGNRRVDAALRIIRRLDEASRPALTKRHVYRPRKGDWKNECKS